MARIFPILLISIVSIAAEGATQIASIQATQTQAVIRIITDQPGACAYRASENNSLTPPVHDVDATLFTGFNLDSRPGSTIQGSQHVFVLGARHSQRALDGKFYSRALQANTVHWIGVTCGSDAEIVASFQTENPPLGRSIPEAPPFDSRGFGNYAWPTIDFTNPAATYADPMTGVLIKRATSSGWREKIEQNVKFFAAFDLNSTWTNPTNILTWPGVSRTLATYSGTAGDPLFVAADLTAIPDYGYSALSVAGFTPFNTPDDVLVRTYGSGSDATAARTARFWLVSLTIPGIPVLRPKSRPCCRNLRPGRETYSARQWVSTASSLDQLVVSPSL